MHEVKPKTSMKYNSNYKLKNKEKTSKFLDNFEKRLLAGHGNSFIKARGDDYSTLSFNDKPSFCPDWMKLEHAIKPFRQHHAGNTHGLVDDSKTRSVPFLTADPDRHSASVCPIIHLSDCKLLIEIIENEFKKYFTTGEINKLNGSAKIFLWHLYNEMIPIAQARLDASRLRKRFVEETGRKLEVFPDNCKKIAFPLRRDKITVVSSGILKTNFERFELVKKVKFQNEWLTEFEFNEMVRERCLEFDDPNKAAFDIRPQMKKQIQEVKEKQRNCYESYDVKEFTEVLEEKQSMCSTTFLSEVEQNSKNLPYAPEPIIEELVSEVSQPATQSCESHQVTTSPNRLTLEPTALRKISNINVNTIDLNELRNEPDAFKKQRQFLLPVCRKAKRVVTLNEGLEAIKSNNMYSGDWSDNESKRENRVSQILKYIARTFDPTKCKTGKSFKFNKSRVEARTEYYCSKKIKKTIYSAGKLFSDGTIVEASENERTYNVAPAYYAITEEILIQSCKTSQFADGGVPESRVKAIWDCLFESGQVDVPWSREKYAEARDYLHENKIITCDYKKKKGKAFCYKIVEWMKSAPQWIKNVKTKRNKTKVKPDDIIRSNDDSYNNTLNVIINKKEHNTVRVMFPSDFQNDVEIECERPPP